MLLVLLLGVLGLLSLSVKSEASLGQYLGGKITTTTPCDEGGSAVVITGGFSSGTYYFSDSAKLYKYGQVAPSKNVLGSYTPGGVCTVGKTSIPITKGTITSVGTSR